MISTLKLFSNFVLISLFVFVISYLLKENKLLNVDNDKLLAIGLLAGLMYLVINYVHNWEHFENLPLKYFNDNSKY